MGSVTLAAAMGSSGMVLRDAGEGNGGMEPGPLFFFPKYVVLLDFVLALGAAAEEEARVGLVHWRWLHRGRVTKQAADRGCRWDCDYSNRREAQPIPTKKRYTFRGAWGVASARFCNSAS